jgi:hypothetical protein
LDHYARISLASRSAAQRDPLSMKSTKHFDLLLPSQQRLIVKQIEAKGFTLSDLQVEHTSRWRWNYGVLDELATKIPTKLRPPTSQRSFLGGYRD